MATVKELGRLRYWLEELRDVRKARDVYYKLAEEVFVKAVTMIVTTLWNRYRSDIKGEEHPKSFALWLKNKWRLENTYHKRFGMKVRRRWASWQIETVTSEILTYSPISYSEQGFRGKFLTVLNQLLASKDPEGHWVPVAEYEELAERTPDETKRLTEAQRRKLTIPEATSLTFNAVLRSELTREAA